MTPIAPLCHLGPKKEISLELPVEESLAEEE